MKRPHFSFAILLTACVLTAGCGPRVDGGGGGAVPSGDPPGIILLGSLIPLNQPSPVIEGTPTGDQVVFPVRFKLHVVDNDSDMRQVLVTVTYTDCNGTDQTQELVHELSAQQQVVSELVLDEVTADSMRVPRACYAQNDRFSVRVRVIDRHGNLSINSVLDDLTIQAGQGSTGN